MTTMTMTKFKKKVHMHFFLLEIKKGGTKMEDRTIFIQFKSDENCIYISDNATGVDAERYKLSTVDLDANILKCLQIYLEQR